MSTQPIGENVLVTGDGHVREYRRSFDVLDITVALWEETVTTIRAEGVGQMHDQGTWECDAPVRYPALDDGDLAWQANLARWPTTRWRPPDADRSTADREHFRHGHPDQ